MMMIRSKFDPQDLILLFWLFKCSDAYGPNPNFLGGRVQDKNLKHANYIQPMAGEAFWEDPLGFAPKKWG